VHPDKQPRTFLFMPESAYGPTNNCVGIGNILRQRGHRVVFAAEASWRGKLAALGFEEDLVQLSKPSADPATQDAGQFWKDFIRDTAPEFRKPTIEQLDTWVKPVWEELIAGVKYSHEHLTDIVARTGADVLIEDNVVSFPALMTVGKPFVRIMSCNPLELPGPGVAPAFSGYAETPDPKWASFRQEYDRTHRALWSDFNEWVQGQGATPLPDMQFMHSSVDLNLYVYPEELDYLAQRPMSPTWHRLESSVRATDEPFELPEQLSGNDQPLIYFSLGSLGSADVELMRRTIDFLSRTPYRVIVSKGPLHAEIDLPDTMWGAEFVPQTSVLPMVDLVITHGGNNTTTEALHFGKPMVVMPLFWDQYDNAQRIHEQGYGIRLDTYGHTETELHAALHQLLTDAAVKYRLAAASARIQKTRGTELAADLIEKLARP
jgi:MGT family glycosyltransferase